MSEPAAGLVVDSNTGIDVALPVAGPGARSFAFLIDWTVRLVLALAWYVAGATLYNGDMTLAAPPKSDTVWFGAIALPALAIYFLYHPVVEMALRGSTPGKRTAGVRIVSRSGAAASLGALLVRNVFRLIDALPACYGIGLAVACISRDSLRWGDMAAGTVLVYERTTALLPLQAIPQRPAPLDAHGAELVAELLQRWSALEPGARLQLARQLLVRQGAAAAEVGVADEHDLHARLASLGSS